MVEIIAAAVLGAGVALFIYFHSKRPVLEVRRSAPEPNQFKERIEVQNHSQSTYSYRVGVRDKYLKWANGLKIITLPPGGASGVILDEVIDDLPYNYIEIECVGWLPSWLLSARPSLKIVYKRKLEEIG